MFEGGIIWIVDAHPGDGKRFIELESAIHRQLELG